MTLRRLPLCGTLLVTVLFALSLPASPVPCGGGTLDFTATSDTPFTLPTFNVGQRTTLTATTIGFTATSFSWNIPGPRIKDYNEDLGTMNVVPALPPPATPLPFSTTALSAADLAASTVTFYWKPSAAQTHPLTGGPEARIVTLTVTPSGGGSCTSSTTFMIERNLTNADKQPEDFYTSTHRSPTETNPGLGHVVDEHLYWHSSVGGGDDGSWLQFLAWHGYFLRRFDEWRAEFGYGPVAPWYPGRPLPTGPAFDVASNLRRSTFNPDNARIPTWYTIAGGTASTSGRKKLGDFATLNDFSDLFEGSYHGTVHCGVGTGTNADFLVTSGPRFGSMCTGSSPKDPLFYRWHGFIDTLYRNYCRIKGLSCHSGPDPLSDPWMGDNAADISAVGTPPSPEPRWISPDIWNRTMPVTTDPCIPRDPPPNVNSVGGVTRDCGSSADHENPIAGVTNYLYATLRNTRPSATRNVYAEVAVYIANASTGLAWPASFTMLPESRQFITLNLEPGQETDIGPLPWTPPPPTPSDHFCIYIRVLSVQEPALSEGTSVDVNVRDSNSIAWRNLKIEEPGGGGGAMFIVRNINAGAERLMLRVQATPALFKAGEIRLRLGPELQRALQAGKGEPRGMRKVDNEFVLTGPDALVEGLQLEAGEEGGAEIRLVGGQLAVGDVQVTQISSKGVDGGVTLRVAQRGSPQAANGFGGFEGGTDTGTPGVIEGVLAGVQSGMNWPFDNFNDIYAPSTFFAVQLERAIAPRWRVAFQAGHHEFAGESDFPNLSITNLSLLARLTGSAPNVRPFLLAGPGAYRVYGTWRHGAQIGAGVEIPVTSNVSLTTQAAWHRVNGGSPQPQWVDGSLGFLFRIP